MIDESIKKVKKSVKPEAAKPDAKAVKKEAVKKDVVKETSVKNKSEVKVSKQKEVSEKLEIGAVVSEKPADKKYVTVSVNVVGIDGKVTGKISLPGEIFGEKLNKALLAQVVRVYLANQRQGTASTKTRGEVEGSTAKIYRQKGTGRARHGSKRAPIFVKGGVVFGPKPRSFNLSIPQKMKRKALFCALSAKVKDNELMIVEGLNNIEPKTKKFADLLNNLGVAGKKQKFLFVTTGDVSTVLRAGRNIQGLHFIPSKLLNTYEVLNANQVIMMKDTIADIKEHFLKK